MITRGPKVNLTKGHRPREHSNSDARHSTEARFRASDTVHAYSNGLLMRRHISRKWLFLHTLI